jgi:hypothetical protein
MGKQAPTIRDVSDLYERENRDILKKTNQTPIVNGNLLTGIVLTTGTTRVPHGLGRPYVGFKIVDKTATADVWRDATNVGSPETFIPLIASAGVTVSIWVF